MRFVNAATNGNFEKLGLARRNLMKTKKYSQVLSRPEYGGWANFVNLLPISLFVMAR
ncbi:hypothetical protein [Nitrosospira sp. NRS527]|uniref:hypothetical protein n=1 Tax=Nitrosospira sp. NRS527 TaxID=155925 RepID=UPI001AFA0DEA|nr:hypothetical protein [Nitrosospira sp. NRS527]BCT68093.1 hypothetical protein NNRS527_01685 [Nitrosospira sp. NRS527]